MAFIKNSEYNMVSLLILFLVSEFAVSVSVWNPPRRNQQLTCSSK